MSKQTDKLSGQRAFFLQDPPVRFDIKEPATYREMQGSLKGQRTEIESHKEM